MSQPEPNLTVVIPVHNAAPHLGACVESLLAQSYTDFELILVENGSSDDSRERCARYAAEHPGRIRTLTLDEASVSAARNAGIDNARGRFITFMDADDWAEKEFLAEFFRDPAPGPGTIVMQGILLDFSEAEPPGPNEAFFSYDDGALAIGDDPSAAVGQRFLQDGCSVCKLYHTETLRRLGIRFIEHLCSREDHLFFFTCISKCHKIIIIIHNLLGCILADISYSKCSKQSVWCILFRLLNSCKQLISILLFSYDSLLNKFISVFFQCIYISIIVYISFFYKGINKSFTKSHDIHAVKRCKICHCS